MIKNRYRRITFFFGRILVSFIFWDLLLPRIGMRKWSRNTRPERLRHSSASFRKLAIQLGGVMIKVGQFLSTRVDVLPIEVTSELSGLQDEVPPVPLPELRKVADAEYGMPLEEKFAWFDPNPLAAASLGQVHRARLHEPGYEPKPGIGNRLAEGERFTDVVVKIQRPNIETIISTDLAALKRVGGWLMLYKPIRRRADIPALMGEFTRTLYQEIDYLAEGHNAETFAANFKGQAGVCVPYVVWTHTTQRALTLENVLAIKITEYEAITAAGVDRKAVAARLLDTYLKQIFEDGFFHADPHPGNLFVYPHPSSNREGETAKQGWQLTFVDFGMVGTLSAETKKGLREMLIGVGTQDAGRVVKAYQMLGVLLPNADLALLEKASAQAFDNFWGKTMSELTDIDMSSMSDFAAQYRDLIYSMPFQVPQNLIFLARTVSILSGMCTGLDPEFNLWEHLAPFAQKMMTEQGWTAALESILSELGVLARSLVTLPKKMDNFLGKLERGEVAVRSPEVSQQVRQLERATRQGTAGIIFVGLLLGSIQLYLAQQNLFGGILLAGSVLSLIWLLLNGSARD
jgi:predicted unusual protein kinase regulating ubiquinone biosynthesis (AarF/ABC1/UbiB family)